MNATGQYFGEAYNTSDINQSPVVQLSGIIGLALQDALSPSMLSLQATPVLDTLHNQGVLSKRMISFVLTEGGKSGSMLLLGEEDLSYAPKGLFWVPRLDSAVMGMWMSAISSFTIGKSSSNNYCPSGCYTLLDSGSSFLLVPPKVYSDLSSTLISAGCQEISGGLYCGSTKGLPYLYISLMDGYQQSRQFYLSPSNYLLSDGVVAIGLMSENAYVLGDVFLRAYYTVFDVEGNQIGIANPADLKFMSWAIGFTILAVVIGMFGIGFGYVYIKHNFLQRPHHEPPSGHVLGGASPVRLQSV